MVVVVENDQASEPEVTGERACLALHAFHHVAVAGENVGEVVEHTVSGPIEACCQMGLTDGHSERVSNALSEWTGGRLDAHGQMALGVARRLAAPLPKAF